MTLERRWIEPAQERERVDADDAVRGHRVLRLKLLDACLCGAEVRGRLKEERASRGLSKIVRAKNAGCLDQWRSRLSNWITVRVFSFAAASIFSET